MQTGKSGRLAQAWRRLNTNTIGTDAYWWIGLQNVPLQRYGACLPIREVHRYGAEIGGESVVEHVATISAEMHQRAHGLERCSTFSRSPC
jgi:hypothetical protein